MALCGTVPADAKLETLELFAQPEALRQPWEQHVATLEQDLGGARFSGKTFEYAQGEQKALCVNFHQWSSSHPYLARMLLHYVVGTDDDIMGPVMPAKVEAPPLPLTADTAVLAPQAASFIAPGTAASQ